MRAQFVSPRLVGVLVAACFVATTAGCRSKKKARIDMEELTATEEREATPLDGVSEDSIKLVDFGLACLSPATGAQFALLPPDNATGNFTKVVQRVPVKISFDPESIKGFEERLRPGLSTEVRVTVQ